MALFINTLAAVTAGTVLATAAFAQTAREVRGPTPYFAVENEAAPKLIVDPAHRTGVRGGRPQTISTGRTSAHNRRRPALVVGGLE